MPHWRRIAAIGALALATGGGARADPLADPAVFAGKGGQLNLILTAKAKDVTLGGVKTTGWVYEACERASPTATACRPGGRVADPYGGVRLQLRPNDTLNIRLVNALPANRAAKHCAENPALLNNPTNLHTHGLIVEPHRSAGPGDPFGDYVFVEVRNPKNHLTQADCPVPPSPLGHAHGHEAVDGAVEYAIPLVNHPRGLFWFHPHMHGVALNQVTSGMAGVITVGDPVDDCAGERACEAAVRAGGQRVLVLKDSQVMRDGSLRNQQFAAFCTGQPAAGETRRGDCPGDAEAEDAGNGVAKGDLAGGHWFQTVNGQVFPDIQVGGRGEIWRVVNASASRSYDLSLQPEGGGEALPLQVLSIDGITIDPQKAADIEALQAQLGRKMEVFRCPVPHGARAGEAVCTRHVRMMPSARVALRVLNEQAGARQAVLRTDHVATGPDADDWPQVDLASVRLAPPAGGVATALGLRGQVGQVLSAAGPLGAAPSLRPPGQARPMLLEEMERRAAPRGAAVAAAEPSAVACRNLGPGEVRRIYFGNPDPASDRFALQTVILGADGQERPETATPLTEFDPAKTVICLYASRTRGDPTTEVWELVNVTGEDHNFHIHQTRFTLLTGGPTQPGRLQDAAVLQDNVPVTTALTLPPDGRPQNCDGTPARFTSGECRPAVVRVRIPFTELGAFVFHCHILEHEDGGMMVRIEVRPPPRVAEAAPRPGAVPAAAHQH